MEPSRRYRPSEVAKMLGITTQTLSLWRREGKIEGTEEKNVTWYTEEQIAKAPHRRHKPGRKAGPNPRAGRAKYEWPEDEHQQQIEKGREMKDDDEDLPPAGPRWRPSDSGKRRILVGA